MEAPADTTWKGFSLAERERRWASVRKHASAAGFDCILVPLCVDGRNQHLSLEQARGMRSDQRYLTLLDNSAVVLPTDGRKAIVISDLPGNDWIPEPCPVNGSWATAMAAALVECRMERARIGVTGLQRGKMVHGRAYSGVVNHTSYAELLRRMPNATFEDDHDVVAFARYVKSQEEIDCLRRGAEIAAAGIEEMGRVARPGVTDAHLYTCVMHRMLELGSGYYPLALYTGPMDQLRLPRFEDPPLGRVLQPNYRIHNETDALWGGLIAQEQQGFLLGPVPDAWQRVVDLQRDLFYTGLEVLKPGIVFGEFVDAVNGFGEKRGGKTLTLMHGRGYGDDGPLITPQDRGEKTREVVVHEGNVFIWKPIAMSADEKIQYSWGGCIVITKTGAEQLVKRTPSLISLQ
ncbi:MAG TPA: M24 family metallopeptidase [Candidatus Binatia bacterium]|nr:M24 family metallopeptidase [Candidatus Binatia bacterium]